jgi:hypothetical protein
LRTIEVAKGVVMHQLVGMGEMRRMGEMREFFLVPKAEKQFTNIYIGANHD